MPIIPFILLVYIPHILMTIATMQKKSRNSIQRYHNYKILMAQQICITPIVTSVNVESTLPHITRLLDRNYSISNRRRSFEFTKSPIPNPPRLFGTHLLPLKKGHHRNSIAIDSNSSGHPIFSPLDDSFKSIQQYTLTLLI